MYLVIDVLIEVLDENVALSRLSKMGVALRPHDATAFSV